METALPDHRCHAEQPQVPLRSGAPQDFSRIRSLCQSVAFTEERLCQALNLESLADLSKVGPNQRQLLAAESEPLAVLIRLFLLGVPVPQGQVQTAIGPANLGALERLDLLRGVDDACLATVSLYPVAGLLIASDRLFNPDGTHFAPPSDLVYPAISPGTLQFLRVIDRAPSRAALDLCTGSGVAALLLSRTAQRATAVDITARSAHFARFNALLNGCGNVDVVEGDLYRDLGNRRFDRIVAHPPYAPALGDSQTWRDGGETGEAVLQGIIKGLAEHLAPGGNFCAVTMGLDLGPQRFEDRVRGWLGEAQAEYDLIFAVDRDWTPRQLAVDLAVRAEDGGAALIARWEEHLQGLGMSRAAYGVLAIHRRQADSGAAGSPFSLRTHLSGATDGEAITRTFERRRWISSPEAGREVAAAAPRLSQHLRVKVTHGVRDGGLAPTQFLLETDWPFRAAIQVEPWLVPVIAGCDGSRTTAHLYQAAKADGALPDDFSPGDFAGMVATLILKGYLEVG